MAARATCPVIASRGKVVEATDGPILLGVDGDDSRAAISTAFELANRLDVDIIAVHAWSKRRSPGDINLPSMIDWDAVERLEQQHLAAALAPWMSLYPDVSVKSVTDEGRPAKSLLSWTNEAQLVVVGSHNRGLLSGAVLGSTGLNLLCHSPVPVMICHAAAQNTGAASTVEFHEYTEGS